MVRRASWWAHARTVIVLGGLGFAGASLVGACLDHYAEDYGCEAAGSAATLQAGSGSGSAVVPATTADCGTAATGEVDAGTGSGSGSAAVP